MGTLKSISQIERDLYQKRQAATSTIMARSFTDMQLSWVQEQSWTSLPSTWGTRCQRADAEDYFREQTQRYDELEASLKEDSERLQAELREAYARLEEQTTGIGDGEETGDGGGDGADHSDRTDRNGTLRACAAILQAAYRDKVAGPEVSGEESIGDTDDRPISLVPFAHTDAISKLQSAYTTVKTAQEGFTRATAKLSSIEELRNGTTMQDPNERGESAESDASARSEELTEAFTDAEQQQHIAGIKFVASHLAWRHWRDHASGVDRRLPAVVRSTIEAMDPDFALTDFALTDVAAAWQETLPPD
jgi:hypothetical protein